MATAFAPHGAPVRGNRFFLVSALLMTLIIVTGFSLNLVMGRSTFAAGPLTHAHAIVFMGWVAIFLTQNVLAATGSAALHRRLGWIAAAWLVPMAVLGPALTASRVQAGAIAFFFQPQYMLIANPLSILAFVGLTSAAIVMRRRTDWHRRLHLCGMTMLLGPGFGRILPMPLLIPYAFQAAVLAGLVFPAAGMIVDLRRDGRVHPAWWWGVGAILATLVLAQLVVYGPLGDAIYRAVTAGTPGAAVPPLAFGAPPG